MSDVREFTAIPGGKRDPCVYCGATDHPAAWACPRIKSITVYGDGVYEVELREPPDPEVA
jgi:hypothetical protein